METRLDRLTRAAEIAEAAQKQFLIVEAWFLCGSRLLWELFWTETVLNLRRSCGIDWIHPAAIFGLDPVALSKRNLSCSCAVSVEAQVFISQCCEVGRSRWRGWGWGWWWRRRLMPMILGVASIANGPDCFLANVKDWSGRTRDQIRDHGKLSLEPIYIYIYISIQGWQYVAELSSVKNPLENPQSHGWHWLTNFAQVRVSLPWAAPRVNWPFRQACNLTYRWFTGQIHPMRDIYWILG